MTDERRDHEKRPSPEALLQEAGREGRGRFKIFLGAAPGVGKTYEMLSAGRSQRLEGVDVVVGVAETHGRVETQALLEGFEVLPRRVIDYKGHVLHEMDLDALLRRRPQLALVDELAHTNAPGTRHPKRYQDVEELLAAGIDVWTTLNIQHVDSLNDIVAQITRIRVRETVPNSIIDRADDIEVIDLTPDDLLRRLKEGKVYVPKTAERAITHYFSPGNLTALRELALRRTAQRVDAQLLSHMQAYAIPGPWAAGERVLVCISEDPRARTGSCDTPSGWRIASTHRGRRSMSRRAAASSFRKLNAIGLRIRCGSPSASAERPRPCRAADATSPTTSSRMPIRQTLRRSSSESRRVRAGSKSSTDRLFTIS